VTGNNIDKKLQQIKSVWHKFAGNQAFEYFFFDEDFAKLYTAEKRTSLIVAVFSVLAIFIACLGLLGLAAFTTEQRTKEVAQEKSRRDIPELSSSLRIHQMGGHC
jgi:putative ABC transport system permease protein